MPGSEVPRIRVAAAIIRRGDKYLLTLRGPGQHGAGHWEFPGGKLEHGESAPEALVRELQEEIGVTITAGPLFHRIEHRYDDRHVELLFHHAALSAGGDEPRAIEVAGLGWFTPREMPALPILPADLPVVDALAALDSHAPPSRPRRSAEEEPTP